MAVLGDLFGAACSVGQIAALTPTAANGHSGQVDPAVVEFKQPGGRCSPMPTPPWMSNHKVQSDLTCGHLLAAAALSALYGGKARLSEESLFQQHTAKWTDRCPAPRSWARSIPRSLCAASASQQPAIGQSTDLSVLIRLVYQSHQLLVCRPHRFVAPLSGDFAGNVHICTGVAGRWRARRRRRMRAPWRPFWTPSTASAASVSAPVAREPPHKASAVLDLKPAWSASEVGSCTFAALPRA